MNEEEIKIIDESNDRKYFTVIPNYILNHSTAVEQALYLQMKRMAGDGGICFATESTLQRRLGIGYKQLKKSLHYLLSKGWIQGAGRVQGKTKPINAYKVIDIWKINADHYEKKKNSESKQSLKDKLQKKTKKSSERGYIRRTTIKKNIISFANNGDSPQKANPDVRRFLKFFGDLWSKRVGNGETYFCTFGKEGKLVKELLKVYSYDRLCEIAERFFDCDNEWLNDKGYTIGMFKTQIPKLIARKESNENARHKRIAELKEMCRD